MFRSVHRKKLARKDLRIIRFGLRLGKPFQDIAQPMEHARRRFGR